MSEVFQPMEVHRMNSGDACRAIAAMRIAVNLGIKKHGKLEMKSDIEQRAFHHGFLSALEFIMGTDRAMADGAAAMLTQIEECLAAKGVSIKIQMPSGN